MPPYSRRWLHPQTVPRGFLRLYILTILSRGPSTGYSMIQLIDERTDGAWRPGAGTMYPLLSGMVSDGLVRPKAGGRQGGKMYALTAKGRKELETARRVISGMGRKEGVMGRLFSDLVPGRVFAEMVVNRFRDGTETFRAKVSEVPEPERTTLLKEYRLLLEAQLAWVALALGKATPRARGSAGHE